MWWAALFSGENGKLIRNIVIGSIVLTIVVILYFMIRSGIKKGNQDKRNNQIISNLENEIQPQRLSYSNSEYQSMADKIYRAVKGAGTDETAIMEVIQKMRTNSDFLKLQTVFGVRDDMSLNEWLLDDLGDSDIDRINQTLRERNISITI